MTRVKRPAYCFVYFEETADLDPVALLSGDVSLGLENRIVAVSIPAASAYVISDLELNILSRTSSTRWKSLPELAKRLGVETRQIADLVEKGLLLGDGDAEPERTYRRRDRRLATSQWDEMAALYHFMSRWRDVDIRREQRREEELTGSRQFFDDLVSRFGSPPGHFHRIPSALDIIDLPGAPDRSSALTGTLLKRSTTRHFDRRRPLDLEDFSTILSVVFGSQGTSRLGRSLTVLKKTSPSGGSLHPIEVYPLVLRVEGLRSGLYHYALEKHQLEAVRYLSPEQGEAMVEIFVAGQSYFRSAASLFVLTARFYRNFWKYRHHRKAYRVVLMDAAHLSQSFYALCTEMGLGAFFTAAINEANIEDDLGLDGFAEGPVGMCGCGFQAP